MTDVKGGLLLWLTNFFDKKSTGSGVNTHANNGKLAEELHKPFIKIFLKRTVYSGFRDNI